MPVNTQIYMDTQANIELLLQTERKKRRVEGARSMMFMNTSQHPVLVLLPRALSPDISSGLPLGPIGLVGVM